MTDQTARTETSDCNPIETGETDYRIMDEETKRLIEESYPYVLKIVNAFKKIDYDDALSAATETMVDAVNNRHKFKADPEYFVSWVGIQVKRKLIELYRSNGSFGPSYRTNFNKGRRNSGDTIDSYSPFVTKESDYSDLKDSVKLLDTENQKLVSLLLKGNTVAEIAEELNISPRWAAYKVSGLRAWAKNQLTRTE